MAEATPKITTEEFIFSDTPVFSSDQLSRYATEDPSVYIEQFQMPTAEELGMDREPDFQRFIDLYDTLRSRLMEVELENFIPEMVSSSVEEHWAAFGIPEGLYSLRDVVASFPNGLNGRDWAWMVRRILMVLDSANRRPVLDLDSILVHPEGHGVVLIGWEPLGRESYPLDELAALMEQILIDSEDSRAQTSLLEGLAKAYKRNRKSWYDLPLDKSVGLFGYGDALREYNMKIEILYGPRKFRELKIPQGIPQFLVEEAAALESRGS